MNSQHRLSISVAGLDAAPDRPWGVGDPRGAIQWAAGAGARAIQLDGSLPGLRARELDRSARRGLAAMMRRLELGFSGFDLWIPPAHFSEPAHSDRAAAAVSGALELAAELASLSGSVLGVVVSASLPEGCDELVGHLASQAETAGVRLADHAWPARGEKPGVDHSVGVGLDPAAVLLKGDDPAMAASQLGSRLVSARLSDASAGVRVNVGQGDLDEMAYSVALATASYAGDLVLDLRGLADPLGSGQRALAKWAQEHAD